MRHAMKERDQYLSPYSPNGGFIAFVWSDAKGIATARKVTLRDVKKFMTRRTLARSFTEKGYRIVQLSCYPSPVLVAPVKRLDNSTLEVNGERLSYAVDKRYNGEVMDCELTLTATYDGETYDVKHISTRAQVLTFLNHETELTKQAEGL